MNSKNIPARELVKGDLLVEGEELLIVAHAEVVFQNMEIVTEEGPRTFPLGEMVTAYTG